MKLIPVETPQDFLVAQQFIEPYEETCVSLASLIRRKSDKLIFITKSEGPIVAVPEPVEGPATATKSNSTVVSRASTTEGTMLGILNLDSTLYHCIPHPDQLDVDFLKNNLPYLMKKPVRCISGETSGTEFLAKTLPGQSPAIVYPYKMLRWFTASEAGVSQQPHHSQNEVSPLQSDSETSISLSTPTLSGGEEIIRCTEHDMDFLQPLQKDYMKEEVAVPGRTITGAEVAITLRKILKNQLCLALTVDGDIVAKANTNAIGINCVQLGGVYTHPLYRRNGYAGALVTALCKRATRADKQPVLFVKEKNGPAITLYQKLGFEECGHYTIAYY